MKIDLDHPSTRACFILCDRGCKPDPERIKSAIRDEFGPGIAIDRESETDWAIALPDCQQAYILFEDKPVPENEAETAARGNFLWPTASEKLVSYGSHAIAVVSVGPEDLLDLNLLLTRLARVALQALDGLGVYWGEGGVANSAEVFLGMSEELDEEDPPIHLWVRFQAYPNQDGSIGLYTQGMGQFNLCDIELDACRWEAQELHVFAHNLAAYLLDEGPVFKDGDIVGGSEEEVLVVRKKASRFEPGKTAYKVTIEAQ